jgi:hypothetical protein
LQDGWKLNRQTVENFLLLAEAGYSANSYHNAIHATDVTQTAAIILHNLAKQVPDLPKTEVFCIIMASAVHDLGHLGVNNDFLINSRHPRATTYNDKSVNENFHIAKAFELARTNTGCDIFELFTFEEQKKVSVCYNELAVRLRTSPLSGSVIFAPVVGRTLPLTSPVDPHLPPHFHVCSAGS